ncbi:MAG: hypothetical protein WC455_28165 [Dehalococcoidia bacterium]|jgi:hypothetical protein
MDLTTLSVTVIGLAGFGACVSALVNLLKGFGVVKDSTAPTWVTGFNLAGVVALFIAQAAGAQLDLVSMDAKLGEVARLAVTIGELVIALGGSKIFYSVVKGTPGIGTSNTLASLAKVFTDDMDNGE